MHLRGFCSYFFGFLLFLLPFVLVSQINAQSCGNYYYAVENVPNYSCPTSKACSRPCVNTTQTVFNGCTTSSNPSITCGAHGNAVGTFCSFGTCNRFTNTRTCETYTSLVQQQGEFACTACPYGGWTDIAGCGQNGCGPTDKQQRRSSSTGGSVCENQYRCRTNTTYCIAPSVPTVTTSSCSTPSNSSTAAWSSSTGATYYALRINKTSVGWDGSCSSTNNPNGGNFCENVAGTSKTFTGESGQSYNWWVHACNANNQCSAAVSSSFTCPPPPINGDCGATLNSCTAGTFSDRADSPTQYLWDCVGSNGGSTASCSQDIPPPPPSPSPSPYFKLKDTSFFKQGFLSSNFPASYSCPASRYDDSDTCTGGYFNQGEAGMVISTGSTLSGGAGGTAISGSSGNIRNWTVLNYSGSNAFTSTSYANYVKAKRNATPVPDLASIPPGGAGGTYSLASGNVTVSPATSIPASYVTIIVNGDLTLNTSDLGRDGVVFIVTGDVTVNGAGAPVKFNGTNRPFALISTGTITFANTLTEADGLYVGNAIEFGTGTTALKIVGNVSSATPSSFDRDRGTTQASMFIVFDPRHLLGIVDKVSTVKSSWRQIQ